MGFLTQSFNKTRYGLKNIFASFKTIVCVFKAGPSNSTFAPNQSTALLRWQQMTILYQGPTSKVDTIVRRDRMIGKRPVRRAVPVSNWPDHEFWNRFKLNWFWNKIRFAELNRTRIFFQFNSHTSDFFLLVIVDDNVKRPLPLFNITQ